LVWGFRFHRPFFLALLKNIRALALLLSGFCRLEISAHDVEFFLGRSKRNFGYSPIAIHQHLDIIAHRMGLRRNKVLG
jgi:hypothetical protein